MNARHFLLIAIALTGHLAQAADPNPKPAAPKPRLVPRSIPGLPKRPTISAPETTVPRVTLSISPTPVVAPTNQARIVAIYRRGTFSVPSETPAAAKAASAPQVDAAQPAIPAAPRPGQIRILTPAEAKLLTTQPSP